MVVKRTITQEPKQFARHVGAHNSMYSISDDNLTVSDMVSFMLGYSVKHVSFYIIQHFKYIGNDPLPS